MALKDDERKRSVSVSWKLKRKFASSDDLLADRVNLLDQKLCAICTLFLVSSSFSSTYSQSHLVCFLYFVHRFFIEAKSFLVAEENNHFGFMDSTTLVFPTPHPHPHNPQPSLFVFCFMMHLNSQLSNMLI